jgi:Zn finger protein HypA/HybF involved in hydrogenase expression
MKKSRLHISAAVISLLTLLGVISCNQATDPAGVPPSTQGKTSGYPHPGGWAAPHAHGAAYVAATDKSTCLNCHDSNNKNTVATRCDTCHSAFPHPERFARGKNHGPIASTFEGKCLNCHQNYTQNLPKHSADGGCLSCHEGELQIQWFKPPPPPPPPPGE